MTPARLYLHDILQSLCNRMGSIRGINMWKRPINHLHRLRGAAPTGINSSHNA